MVIELPPDLTPLILQGHVLEVLRGLPSDSIQCVVTSPPYWGLRAYGTEPQVWGGVGNHVHQWGQTSPRRQREEDDGGGEIQKRHEGASYQARGGESCVCGAWRGELGLEPTPELFVQHLAEVFDEVRRVIRPDGTLWLDLGDTYATHPAGLTGAARWKASTLNNRDNTGAEQAGAFDKRAPGLKPKDMVGIPWRVAFELQRRGWWLRSDCVWAKPNPMPESVTDRPTRSHEYVFLLTKSARYFYDADAVRTQYSQQTMPEIGEKYSGTASKAFREYRAQDASEAKRSMIKSLEKNGGANLKSVWWIATEPFPEGHFSTFPKALAETCLRAATSERGSCVRCGMPWERKVHGVGGTIGHDRHPYRDLNAQGIAMNDHQRRGRPLYSVGINGKELNATYRRVDEGFKQSCACESLHTVPCLILDPFCGSGTVLQVARSLSLRSIGIELKPEYAEMARRRCRADVPDLESFTRESAAQSVGDGGTADGS